MSHLNHLKEQTNILHLINEAQLFHWTHLRNGRLERFNGTWEPCVWICSLLLTHCYNLCCLFFKSPTDRLSTRVFSPQQSTWLLACETSCQVSNREMKGLTPPEWL